MKLWLSRQRDGTYMLTRLKPVLHEVGKTGFTDFYLVHGEPIGVRHLCTLGVKAMFGVELQIGEQAEVDLIGNVIGNFTDQSQQHSEGQEDSGV